MDKVDNNYLAVLEGMLEFNHDERFQSAAKLKGVFEALKKGDSPEINLPVKRNIASADLIYDGGRDFSVSRAKFGFGEGVAV